MPKITVAKPFTLTLASGEVRNFAPGIHDDVPDEVADHWFAKHHFAKDGKVPQPVSTTPLTHEERTSMKLALDDAEARVKAAEGDAEKAQSERDNLKAAFGKLADENMALKTRVAALEADLDKATKPVGQTSAAKK